MDYVFRLSFFDAMIRPLSRNARTFCAVTGARNVATNVEENYITFTLPRGFTSNKAHKVKIGINGKDLYYVEFYNRAGRLVDEIQDCYVDELARVFREHTALQTDFPRFS